MKTAEKWAGFPIGLRDTKRDAAKRKRARRRRRVDRAYLGWIHTQPCVVTGKLPVSAHHEPPKSADGGTSWHDWKTVPLIPDLHIGNSKARHGCGSLEIFEAIHGVVIAAEIERLNAKYLAEHGL